MSVPTTLVSVSAFAAAFFLACSGAEEAGPGAPPAVESPAPLTDPVAAFEAARGRVDVLAVELAERRAIHEQAVAEAEDARTALAHAEEELAASDAIVDETALALDTAERELAALQPEVSDDELFRDVQRALLEAEALSQVAIRAEIVEGTVVLHGTVPDVRLRDGAEQVARRVPGVLSVSNEIEIAL